MSFTVVLTEEAVDDLQRLEDFLFATALEHGDPGLVAKGMSEIRAQMRILEFSPWTCRMAHDDPLERELIVSFGGSGYVALFSIVSAGEVVITAVRHQREDDYH